MSISILKGAQHDAHLWTELHEVESSALDQLRNVIALPWIYHHVAVMPDVHWGNGATVGSVIAMKDAVCPAAVGVDIGCGMAAQKIKGITASDLPDNLKPIRMAIEDSIPVGFNAHEEPVVKDHPLWTTFQYLHERVQDRFYKIRKQCGTLGGGNHFIELSLDENDDVWMVLHSGSRNAGKELAESHIWVAKTLEHNKYIPGTNRELAVFLANTPEFAAYRRDLMWAQDYALLNRQTMLNIYRQVIKSFFSEITFEPEITCHHNYVAEENHFGEKVYVTRKGAINAEMGRLGIIPGSMGA